MYILIIPLVYFIVNTYTLTHEIPRLLPLFQSNSVVTLSRGLKCFFPVTSDELSISTSLELNTISGASEQENFNKTLDTILTQLKKLTSNPVRPNIGSKDVEDQIIERWTYQIIFQKKSNLIFYLSSAGIETWSRPLIIHLLHNVYATVPSASARTR